ncbi:autoinducer 2 kinase LsrK, partial [Yersinia pestis PY-08]
MPVPAV